MGEPNMKGSTGLLELGVSWQAQKAWTFDANLRGMAGKHERVTGMVTEIKFRSFFLSIARQLLFPEKTSRF